MKFRCQKRGALVLNAAAQYGFVPGIGQGDIYLARCELIGHVSPEAPFAGKTSAPPQHRLWQGNICEET
jgi:hypothetical protein